MIWSCIEISVGVMVVCMPHIRNLVRHITSRIRERKGTGKKASNKGVFIDRSLATITADDATMGLELHDDGGLLKGSTATRTMTTTTMTTATTITGGTMEIINAKSTSFASDADIQV
jgi:hypothetical protein